MAEETDSNLAKPGIATWSNQSSNRTAVATIPAVEELAAVLMNITRPTNTQLRLQHKPGRLMVKFKELYGQNYSAVAQLVNDWAGIELVKVNDSDHVLWTVAPPGKLHRRLNHDAVGIKPYGVPSCCTAQAEPPTHEASRFCNSHTVVLAGPAWNRNSCSECEQQPIRSGHGGIPC